MASNNGVNVLVSGDAIAQPSENQGKEVMVGIYYFTLANFTSGLTCISHLEIVLHEFQY